MSCRLCRKDKELRKSHIIPEFLYTPLYDKKHRFNVLSSLEYRPRPIEQKGLREKLLCEECEGQLSQYEKYAREVLFGGEPITVQKVGELIEVSNLNYEKFKLFQLSILWRASVSSEPFFSRVHLGPHEDRIRMMIRNHCPGATTDYPCILFGLTSISGIEKSFIDQPTNLRINGHQTYRFIFGGFMWSYYVSSHALPPLVEKVALNERGKVIVGQGPIKELTHLKTFAVDLHKMGRLNKPTE